MTNARAVELSAVQGKADPTNGPLIELRLIAVDESASVPSGEGGMPEPIRWNVLAYEVELKSRRMALTRAGFEQVVRNFVRYGQVPVVLFHADTDPAAHPDAAAAHGWLTELRVGSMVRNSTAERVSTLEGRIRWLNADTRRKVESGELAFGSITILMDAVDEETNEEIGQYLYSFSLTNKPALKDMPRIQAQRAVPASAPNVPAERKPTQNAPALTSGTVRESLARMHPIIALAALLGLTTTDEPAALTALQMFAADVGKLLGLGDKPRADSILAKLTAMVNESAKLPEVQKQLSDALAELSGIRKVEAQRAVAALQASGNIAKNDKARDAAIALFMRDRAQFTEIFGAVPAGDPAPNRAAADQLLQVRVTPDSDGERADFSGDFDLDFSELTANIAAELHAKNPTEYPTTYEGKRKAIFDASRMARTRMEHGDSRH